MFTWLAFCHRIWTADRRPQPQLQPAEQGACWLCDQEDETANHLLVNCSYAKEVPVHFPHLGRVPVPFPRRANHIAKLVAAGAQHASTKQTERSQRTSHASGMGIVEGEECKGSSKVKKG
ncbi:hypothetical protein EJB05_00245, partial [Eragrostis curvula]